MARLHRVLLGALLITFTGLAASASPQADSAALKFTPPPGEETPEVKALIDRAKGALESGRTATEILTDGTFMPVHAWPRFRALIRDHAPTGTITLAPTSEPGDALHIRGTIRDTSGQPLKNALIYVYQTSAKGWYSDKAAHISGNSGDTRHARLFGYLRADTQGKYEVHTIRPAGYPATDLPAHVHMEIHSASDPPRSHVTEIRFEDDPRMTPAWRERSQREGFLMVPVKRDSQGAQQIVADFQVR